MKPVCVISPGGVCVSVRQCEARDRSPYEVKPVPLYNKPWARIPQASHGFMWRLPCTPVQGDCVEGGVQCTHRYLLTHSVTHSHHWSPAVYLETLMWGPPSPDRNSLLLHLVCGTAVDRWHCGVSRDKAHKALKRGWQFLPGTPLMCWRCKLRFFSPVRGLFVCSNMSQYSCWTHVLLGRFSIISIRGSCYTKTMLPNLSWLNS